MTSKNSDNISNNDSDLILLNHFKKICSNINDNFNHPYKVFYWQSIDLDRLSIENFLMMTNNLHQTCQEECMGENLDALIEKILAERFYTLAIQQYIQERNLLIKNFLQYFKDEEVKFSKLESSCDETDKTWVISTTNEKENFAVLIINLPIILDHHNTPIKPIKAYCDLWYESSNKNKEELVSLFCSLHGGYQIISLAFYEFYLQNYEFNRKKFIDRILNDNIQIDKIPNEKELSAIDRVERNKVDVEYMDIEDEEYLVETTGEDGYFIEIEAREYEIDLQDILEENRLQEIKKQVYSHMYTFNDFFYSVWSAYLCVVKSQHGFYGYSLSQEVTNDIVKLANLFVSQLENIRIYAVREDLYLIGQLSNQRWIGIHHVITRTPNNKDIVSKFHKI